MTNWSLPNNCCIYIYILNQVVLLSNAVDLVTMSVYHNKI